ncbi:probable disease resistance protein At4g27220 [Durio zibethinus]|uniref:Probable disease resistance protein At4g27220 n=1 Tax=Durio zibethinus TaxID=66656 RepID=A0A6P5WU89_DURZI|nr:probable disease resistance protein At4g27220 [Durio zibethinus]
MESIVSGAANKVVECTFGVIKRGFVYIIYVDSNVQNLKMQVRKLMDAQARVQQNVDRAKRNAEEIFPDVNSWLIEVNKKISEHAAAQLKEDEEKAKKKCFIGLCPNFKSRYQLSKKAEEEAQAIIQLLGEGKFDKVSHSVAPDGIVIKGYKAFESRTSAMEGIMEAVRESSVRIVGIHGMAGVGKTTLAKEVASKVREENLFDEVAIAMVSHNPVIRQIQGEIADMLGLKFDVETDSGRAMQLRWRLKNGKRILIILDDLWQKLDLEAVGISYDNEAAQKSSTAGCKILLTSRSLDVLRLMDAERSFEVKILSQEESMILFANIVGEAVGKSDDYQRIADELVKICAGLPVAILAIANTLKRRDLPHWKDALRQLQRSISSNIKGVKDDVHYTIELSYRWLIKEEAQSLFLLCGLHPQGFDILVSDLLQYCIGLDMLKGIKTVEEARERIDVLVDMLKDSSLLLEGKDNEWVKMHDLIRDVSLSIASKDKRMLVIEDEDRRKELLKEGKLNDCTAISLPYSNIHELSRVERSKLELLMLLNKDSSFQISDTFFEGMNELKVLNVTGMNFPSLPSSFLSLTNLRTLRLYQCNLSEIAIIRNLKKLDILSFQGSSIKQLPVEIAELTQLKLLDLSECYKLKVIPAKVISKLSRLEELYVGNSFCQWNVDGNAQLPELKNLSCLSALHVYIPDAQIMPKDLFSVKLGRYKFAIGSFDWDFFGCEGSKALQLKLDTGIHLDEGIKMLVEKTEELRIEEFKGAENVLYELDREGFPHLKRLRVVDSSDMKCIIKSIGSAPHKAFPVLESLELRLLTGLEKICDGQLKTESFSRLKTVDVAGCDRLKYLFSVSIAKNLYQLQEIGVWKCENMKEIVVEEEGREENVVEFRQLRSLELRNLLKLKSFYSMEETPSLIGQGGSVSSSNMVPLFNGKVVFPAIKELVLRSLSSIGKLWDDQFPAAVMTFRFQNLSRLEVRSCHKLKYAFPSSMVKSFVQLKTLVVRECEDMEEVIAVSAEEETDNIMVFPKLNSLQLGDLPNLKRFCCGINPIEFSILRELEIRNCPLPSTFYCDSSTSVGKNSSSISMDHNLQVDVSHCLFNDKVALPMLQRLSISSMKNLERLWPNQLAKQSFPKLSYFYLGSCDKLVNVFPSSILTRLERLEELIIRDCELVEEIFEPQQADGSIATATFEFPWLTSLELIRLPRLKSFYHKMYAPNCPSLKEMNVRECHKVEILFSFQETDGVKSELELVPIQQSLISVNKFTFPTLQQLTLGWNDGMKEIWHCSAQQQQLLASHYFSKLKFVTLYDFPEQLAIFPSYLLQLLSFPNLETLEIRGAYFKEIFPSDGVGEENPASAWVLLSRLTALRLVNLHELMHLWKEKEGFQNLRIFKCAKSLVQLKEMKIRSCENIEEITQGSGG